MVDRAACSAALAANIDWFRRSGVMDPPDGSWGVAERIVLTDGNSAAERITRSFPAWTPHEDHIVVEQRRSDCNFQTAWMLLLAAEAGLPGTEESARKILEFLYFRSGLLNRSNEHFPAGVWNWSHIRWEGVFWLDDDGWAALLQLVLALARPDWDRRFQLRKWSEVLLHELDRVLKRFRDGRGGYLTVDPLKMFNGDPGQPHWGVPTVLALLFGAAVTGENAWNESAEDYLAYLLRQGDSFNNSESAYGLILLACAAALRPERDDWRQGAFACGDRLLRNMAANHGIPAAQHGEAPQGEELLDTIYTANWLLLGLQSLAALPDAPERFQECYETLLKLFLAIQDDSPSPALRGCWRGMYDCKHRRWGGGDHYEGGANSIYTGWTNAPIAAVLAMELKQTSLAGKLAEPAR